MEVKEKIRFIILSGDAKFRAFNYMAAKDIYSDALSLCNQTTQKKEILEFKKEVTDKLIKSAMSSKDYSGAAVYDEEKKLPSTLFCNAGSMDLKDAANFIRNYKGKCNRKFRHGILHFNRRRSLWKRIESNFNNKEYIKVLDALEPETGRTPWRLNLIKAECCARTGKMNEAIKIVQPLIDKTSTLQGESLYITSLSHLFMMNWEEAENFMKRALAASSEDKYKSHLEMILKMSEHGNKLQHFMIRREFQQAVVACEAMINVYPEKDKFKATLLSKKAEAHFSLNEFSLAYLSCISASNLDHYCGPAYVILAKIYESYGMYDDAVTTLKLCQVMDPSQNVAHALYVNENRMSSKPQRNYSLMLSWPAYKPLSSTKYRIDKNFIKFHPDKQNNSTASLFQTARLPMEEFTRAAHDMLNRDSVQMDHNGHYWNKH